MAHWSDKYIGKPYIADQHDCAVFAALVQGAEFGRLVLLPAEHAATPFARSAQISARMSDYLQRTDAPVDGDVVMALAGGRLWHIGVLAVIAGERWMVHASNQAGAVIATRMADLPLVGLKLDGYYQCKP